MFNEYILQLPGILLGYYYPNSTQQNLVHGEDIHFLEFIANFRCREVEGGGSGNHGEEKREEIWMCVYVEI